MRKIIALAMATLMVVAMAITAFAYSITVTNTNENITIDGKTYTAYKLFDMTYAGMSGTPDDPSGSSGYSYTIDSDGDGAWAWDTLINGATSGTTAGSLVNGKYGLTFTPSAGDPTVYVVTSTMTEAQAYELAADLQDKVGSATVKFTGKASGETAKIEVGDDQPGYYVVMGTADPKKESGSEITAAVTLTSTNPDVTIQPKADANYVDKEIGNSGTSGTNGTTVNVGDTVDFVVRSKVPHDMRGYNSGNNPYRFTFRDTMSDGLTFDGANSVKVYIGGKLVTGYDLQTGSAAAPYTFTLTIKDLTIYDNDAPIVIEYTATVNEKAQTTDEEHNTISLNYSNNPYDSGSSGSTPDDTVYVYEFNIKIDKFEKGASGTKLDGAEFVLRKASGTGYAYYKEDSGTVTWVATQAAASTIITDGSGSATFRGVDSGSYQLVEITAPKGYNLLDQPINVTITVTFNEDGTIASSNAVYTSGSNHTLTVPVENSSGTILPSTGGIGTTIFYIVGGLLAVGAGVVLVAKKRMGKVED